MSDVTKKIETMLTEGKDVKLMRSFSSMNKDYDKMLDSMNRIEKQFDKLRKSGPFGKQLMFKPILSKWEQFNEEMGDLMQEIELELDE